MAAGAPPVSRSPPGTRTLQDGPAHEAAAIGGDAYGCAVLDRHARGHGLAAAAQRRNQWWLVADGWWLGRRPLLGRKRPHLERARTVRIDESRRAEAVLPHQ